MINRRTLLNLHRRMGVVSALFVVLLSLSGLFLHHSSLFKLDENFIKSSGLLAWYRIEIPRAELSFSSNGHSVSLLGDALYFNDRRLPGIYADLKGILLIDSVYVLATEDQLILLTDEGELVESLGGVHGVPAGIDGLGSAVSSAGVQIFLRANGDVIEVDLDLLSWLNSDFPESQIFWSEITQLDLAVEQQARADYGASLLSWERLMLDIHSGRLFGTVGVFLVDMMAILFMLMALSGIWIWSRRGSKR